MNIGDAPLELKEIVSQCACTAAQTGSAAPASPTQRRPIEVTFHTANLSAGPVSQKVLVKTNNPITPVVEVTVQAIVEREIDVTPAYIDFGTLRLGEPAEREVTITSRRADVTVKHVQSTNRYVVPRLRSGAATVRIAAALRGEPGVGSHSGVLVIGPTSRFVEEIRIPFAARVTER